MAPKKRVLFLCAENACRSQMAEGFLRSMAGDRYVVASAGTTGTKVNPRAIAIMAESGIDISSHQSKPVSEFDNKVFDYVITVCEANYPGCPIFRGQTTERLHWPFEDPAHVTGDGSDILDTFRCVRDQIRAEIERFAERDKTADLETIRTKNDKSDKNEYHPCN